MANYELKAILTAQDNASSTISKVGGAFNTLAKVGLAAAAAGVALLTYEFVKTAKAGLKVASDMEQTKVAFDTMLGSADLASKTLKQLSDFAVATPFTLPEVLTGAKQLAAYGFEAGDLTKQMKMLGDVAAGLSIPLGDLVYVYGTLKAQGRAYTRDLMQFAMRGIPIYDELAKVMGVSKDKIQDLVAAGSVGFEQVQQAFQGMTGEGGKFYNLMDKQSKTFSGVMSNMQDQLTRTLMAMMGISTSAETFGEVIAGGLFDRIRTAAQAALEYINTHQEDIVNWVTNAINSGIAWTTQVAIPWIQTYWPQIKNAIESVISSISNLINWTRTHQTEAKILGMVILALASAIAFLVGGPMGMIAGIIGGITLQFIIWRNVINTVVGAIQWLDNVIGNLERRVAKGVIGGITSGLRALRIPGFQSGGIVQETGLAYLHKGERVTPSASVTNNDNGVTVNFYGNIANTANASLDAIGQRLGRSIELARQGI